VLLYVLYSMDDDIASLNKAKHSTNDLKTQKLRSEQNDRESKSEARSDRKKTQKGRDKLNL